MTMKNRSVSAKRNNEYAHSLIPIVQIAERWCVIILNSPTLYTVWHGMCAMRSTSCVWWIRALFSSSLSLSIFLLVLFRTYPRENIMLVNYFGLIVRSWFQTCAMDEWKYIIENDLQTRKNRTEQKKDEQSKRYSFNHRKTGIWIVRFTVWTLHKNFRCQQ